MRRLLLALLLFVPAAPALAHKASDAYLTLERDGTALRGQWDIALRDLDNALDLDANGDGDITWGEVRARASDIAGYALHRLQISSDGERCALASTSQLIDVHTDGAYTVLMLTGRCPQSAPTLAIRMLPPRRLRMARPLRDCSTLCENRKASPTMAQIR